MNFYLGQDEDYTVGDSTLEKLLQRGRREGQYICDSDEGRVHAIKHIFFLEGFCQSDEAFPLVTINSHHHEGF